VVSRTILQGLKSYSVPQFMLVHEIALKRKALNISWIKVLPVACAAVMLLMHSMGIEHVQRFDRGNFHT